MRKIFIFLSIYVLSVSWVTSQSIENNIKQYFQSESYKKCNDIWKKYRVGYENTLVTALKGGYGHQMMNVYIKRPKDALLLSNGYYHSDNQVEILFQEILLEEFPYLINPEISFDLCGNALSIESTLSKMIIHSDYFLFRNRSDIIYSLKNQDQFESSPFRFQQVQNTGQIAVTAEKCMLLGTVLTKLDGHSVNVGVDMLKLKDCQFNVDVYSPGQKTPPVLASYLFEHHGPNEKNILEYTLSKEMIPQLQAALFAHVNTSAIFAKELFNIQHQQKLVMGKVESYIDNVLGQINKQTIENNKGTVDLDDFDVNWDDAFDGTKKDCEIRLTEVTMSGLDSAYSAHIGGPYKIEKMPVKIGERVRMSNLKVLGVITLRGMFEGDYNFAADIHDVDIDIKLDVETLNEKHEGNKNNKPKHTFIVGGWRSFEFSCPDLEELPIEAIVTGFILDELPEYLLAPLRNIYNQTIYSAYKNEKDKNNFVNLENSEEEYNGNHKSDKATDKNKNLANEDKKILIDKDYYDKAAAPDKSNAIFNKPKKDGTVGSSKGNDVQGGKGSTLVS